MTENRTLRERVETMIDVFRQDKYQPAIARELRRIAEEYGPDLRPTIYRETERQPPADPPEPPPPDLPHGPRYLG